MAFQSKSLSNVGMFVAVVTAFVSVPLFFNMHAYQSFVLDKALLLQWIGLILVVSLLGRVLLNSRHHQQRENHPWPRELVLALFLPLTLYTLDVLMASVFTINRFNTLIGSYDRMDGLFSFLAYVALFVSVYLLAKKQETQGLLLDVLIGASIPVALYGLMQHFGIGTIDAATGMRSPQIRIISTLGNPIFLAEYLTLLFFPTLYRLVELFMRSEAEWAENLGKYVAVAAVYLFALIADLTAIVLSQSRGASLSLVVATGLLLFLGVLLFKPRGYRYLLYGSVFFLLIFIPMLITVGTRIGGKTSPADVSVIRQLPLLGRFSLQDRNTRARLEIWQSALSALTPGHDLRIPPEFRPDPYALPHRLVGYGLDTQEDIYPQFLPPSEFWRTRSVDRAHNGLLDVWMTSGVLGLLFYLWMFMGVVYLFFRRLFSGLRPSSIGFALGLIVGAVVLGGAGVRLLDGSFRLVPPLTPLFTVIGILIAALVLDRLAPGSRPHGPMPKEVPLLFLFGGLMVYYLNQSTGIPTPASNMVFWSLLALYAVLGGKAFGMPSTQEHKRRRHRGGALKRENTLSSSVLYKGALVVAAVLMSFTLAYVLVFSVQRRELSPWTLWVSNFTVATYGSTRFYGWPKVIVIGLSLLSLSILFAQYTYRRSGRFWRETLRLLMVSTGAFLLFSFVLSYGYARLTAAERVSAQLFWLGNFSKSYYLFLTLIVGSGIVFAAWRKKVFCPRDRCLPTLASFGFASILTVVVLLRYVMPTSVADVYFKYAAISMNSQDNNWSKQAFPVVVDLVSYRPIYYFDYAQVLFRDVQQHPENEKLLRETEALLLRARDVDPLNSDPWKNLATLYSYMYEKGNKAAIQKALESARVAVFLRPYNAPRRVFYAKVLFKAGQDREGLRQLDKARTMDPTYRDTYIVASSYFLTQGNRQEALSYLQAWLEQDPADVEVLLQVARLYVQMQDVEKADAYIQKALSVAPNNYSVLYTAATLYREGGRPREALDVATRAGAVASSDVQKKRVDDLINTLQREIKDHAK